LGSSKRRSKLSGLSCDRSCKNHSAPPGTGASHASVSRSAFPKNTRSPARSPPAPSTASRCTARSASGNRTPAAGESPNRAATNGFTDTNAPASSRNRKSTGAGFPDPTEERNGTEDTTKPVRPSDDRTSAVAAPV